MNKWVLSQEYVWLVSSQTHFVFPKIDFGIQFSERLDVFVLSHFVIAFLYHLNAFKPMDTDIDQLVNTIQQISSKEPLSSA